MADGQQKQPSESQKLGEFNKLLGKVFELKRILNEEAIDPFHKKTMEAALKRRESQVNEAADAGEPIENIIKKSEEMTGNASGKNDTFRNLLMALGGGLAAAGGNKELAPALLKMIQSQQEEQSLTPQKQMETLLESQRLAKEEDINAKISVTAEGVPTFSVEPTGGIESLGYKEGVQAWALAVEIGKARGAHKLLPTIVKGMQQGRTADQMRDELRFSQQSPEFSGTIRNAAQQITAGKSQKEREATFDSLDDLISQGDNEGAKELMKRMAVKNVGETQRQSIMGQERTIELLGEIKGSLNELESDGFNTTGFFTGNVDKLLAKVGQIKDPKHMELATKISLAVIQFRRAMTGVQFGMKEHAEYAAVFPGIDKVRGLNLATLEGLTSTFKGNVRKFYQQSMGTENYNKLFGSGEIMPGFSSDEWEVVNE